MFWFEELLESLISMFEGIFEEEKKNKFSTLSFSLILGALASTVALAIFILPIEGINLNIVWFQKILVLLLIFAIFFSIGILGEWLINRNFKNLKFIPTLIKCFIGFLLCIITSLFFIFLIWLFFYLETKIH